MANLSNSGQREWVLFADKQPQPDDMIWVGKKGAVVDELLRGKEINYWIDSGWTHWMPAEVPPDPPVILPELPPGAYWVSHTVIRRDDPGIEYHYTNECVDAYILKDGRRHECCGRVPLAIAEAFREMHQ